jgi:hypothetical protein
MQSIAHRWNSADSVKQSVVVIEVFVAHHRDVHSGAIELASVGQAFVAEDVLSCALCRLHVLVKASGSNLGQLPTLRHFANADSLFSDPGRVEAQAA